jgi:hypothetical protein
MADIGTLINHGQGGAYKAIAPQILNGGDTECIEKMLFVIRRNPLKGIYGKLGDLVRSYSSVGRINHLVERACCHFPPQPWLGPTENQIKRLSEAFFIT